MSNVTIIPSDIERSAADGQTTLRSTYTNSARNKNLTSKLQQILNSGFEGEEIYDDLPSIQSVDQLQQLLSQLIIRFDTKPDYYTKKDYQLLIGVLTGALTYLYNHSAGESDIADLWKIIQSLKLEINDLKTDIDEISTNISSINTAIEFLSKRFDNYVQESEFEYRVNELIEQYHADDPPQQAPQKQITYIGGDGIKITATDTDTRSVNAVIKQPITVSNVSIGGYSDGMTIDQDTPIVDILKTILQKVVDVVAVEPSVKLTGQSQSVEYGSSVTSNLTISLTQGYFKPADNSWVADNQYMGYKITGVPSTWTIQTNGMSATASYTQEVTSSITYSGYTVNVAEETPTIPTKSNGEASSVRCDKSSLTTSGSVTITPYYYLFFGPVNTSDIKTITSDTVRNLTRKKASFPLSNQTISEQYNGGGKSILVACPSQYSLNAVTDAMGNSILDLFKQQISTLEIPCGNSTPVEYNLYLYPITNGADQAYKNLTFKLE